MDTLFLKPLNMSIAAGWLILLVLVLRVLLKKAPKYIYCILWGIVGLRLICPFSFESVFSLVPSKETLPPEVLFSREPTIQSGVEVVDRVVNPAFTASFAPPDTLQSVNPLQVWIALASYIWILGMVIMLVYAAFSYWRVRRKLGEAIRTEGNIWQCDHVASPFILGMFRPRIYLPSDMVEADRKYVIAHEQAHLKRKDHWWKPLAYTLLIIYWFNPLCWIAYSLLCKDIELACDEKVVRTMDAPDKKAYSKALLSCSVSRRMISACPLAFGEVSVKERVKGVLNYKKPAFWISVAAVVICVVVAVCFLTNPKEDVGDASAIEINVELQPIMGILPEIPEAVLQFAKEYVWKDIDTFETKGYRISEAKIIGMANMSPIRISTTDDFHIEIYSLEYRLKPDDLEKVVLTDGRSLDDGWITAWNDLGQPYIVLLCAEDDENIGTQWELIGDFRTNEMGEYYTEEIKYKYSNPYEAIAMKLYEDYVGTMSAPRAALLLREFDVREALNWTLYLENGDAWRTYQTSGDDSAAGRLELFLAKSFSLQQLKVLPEEVGDYWIIISAEDGKTMTFYPADTGIVAYFNGTSTTYWSATSVYDNLDNITEDIRQQYDNLEVRVENMQHSPFVYNGNAEEAVHYFAGAIYGLQLQNLAPGNSMGISDYRVIDSKAIEVSEDGNAAIGYLEYAIIPWDDNAHEIWGDNAREGTGEYEGWLIVSREFALEKQEDGRFKCTGLGTGVGQQLSTEEAETEQIFTLDEAISAAILAHYKDSYPNSAGLLRCESHVILDSLHVDGVRKVNSKEENYSQIIAYVWALYEVYSSYGAELKVEGGSSLPLALTFGVGEDGAYVLEEYWEPRSGAYYDDDIRERFPKFTVEKVLGSQTYIEELKAECLAEAKAYMSEKGSIDEQIEALLGRVSALPLHASMPPDVSKQMEEEYNQLLAYGEYTLRYCFEEFLEGGQTDLRGHIMVQACEEIMIGMGEAVLIDYEVSTGQEWFDAFQANAHSFQKQYTLEELEKFYPATWLLLKMETPEF